MILCSRLVAAAVATMVALGLAPAPGVAATAPVPSVLTINGPAGSVRIHTDPYRVEVLDTAGRVRLSEVANTKPGPKPYVSLDPAPVGSAVGQTAPMTSPLVLIVGVAKKAYFPALFWSGNLLLGATAGMQYSATSVLSYKKDGSGGLVLEVGTNAPTGERFSVHLSPSGQRFVLDVTVIGGKSLATRMVSHTFDAPASDAFHGFGGRHEGTNLRGSQFHSWTAQENFGVGPLQGVVASLPATGGQSYMFPNGPGAAYYVQPQFVSQKYAFLADQTDLLRWRMAPADTPNVWQVIAPGRHLREVVVPADPTSSVPELTRTTGRNQVPPAWALGPQLDRLVYTGDSAATYKAKVEDDLARLESGTLPATAYRIEGWGILERADLITIIARLRKLGIHPLAYFRSFASVDVAGTEKAELFTEALTKGYGATTALGTPYIVGGTFGGPALVIDLTKPSARKWFAGRITEALDLGFDGFMADFGEQVQPDMHFANGEDGTTMHNKYAVLYQQVVDETVNAFLSKHPERSVFRYNRAGFTGSAGHEMATFPGDETTDFSKASGLASLTPDMLNRGIGGAYGFTTDIGGYEDHLTGKTSPELLIRWAEWAVLSPVFRLHGSAQSGTHMPWDYDAATLAAYKKLSLQRQAVAPLIGKLWVQARKTGMPIATPLWLAYPHDPMAAKQDQQWLLGPDVLAAPVVTQGATTRTAYLPEGCWVYQPTKKQYSGKRSVTVPAPLGTLSWFVRCGKNPLG